MRRLYSTVALAGLLSVAAGVAGAETAASGPSGDYVEARTASVFAGACHYNGELTTTGRDAEIAWHIRSGSSHSVDVSGLNALAAISGADNLKEDSVARRSVLFIDEHATDAQMKVVAGLLMTNYKAALGHVLAIKRAPIHFTRTGDSFRVVADGVGKLTVDAMPNRECCKQPNLVWYRPFGDIKDRRVGYTRESGIQDSTLGASWSKYDQNTAFYGTFSLL